MQRAVEYIRAVNRREPRVAVVLGSGLGAFADELADPISIPYSDDSRLARIHRRGTCGKAGVRKTRDSWTSR